jgi:response regulator RpfG family c-di-GMP phosphodiesterase
MLAGLVSTAPPSKSAGGLKILDRLRDDARISASQYESVYHQAKRSGEPIVELLIETNAISEHEVLKAVAHLYKTRFVSTDRLAKAGIDRQTLQMVPRRVCERYQCCPVVFDPKASSLSIVVADLEEDVAKDVQVVTGVREVRAYIARPAAITASIRKYYGGDPAAFAKILPSESKSGLPPPLEDGAIPMPTGGPSLDLGLGLDFDAPRAPGPRPGGPRANAARPPQAPRPVGTPANGLDLGGLDVGRPAPPAPPRPAPSPAPSLNLGRFDATGGLEDKLGSFEAAPDYASYLETVKVLVTLLDQGRGELRGHSAHVASIAVKIGQRMSMSAADKNALAVAAYLHDIGKTSTAYHLTALNVSRFDGHRIQAQKSFDAPTKLFDGARLNDATKGSLEAMYERWDGKGFPKNLEGKQIPLGARILSLTETYCDLTTNTKNPYRRVLTPREAVEVVRQLGSQLFDPSLLDPLRLVVGSDRATNVGLRPRVLIVEPDPEQTMLLELRFQEQGYDVTAARSRIEGETRLRNERFDIVITEVDLDGGDGFSLVAVARAEERNKDVAFVFHTRRADRESVARGFELGAADYLTKPTAPELVVAKSGQIFEALLRRRGGGGLSGSLRDMGLSEVMQVLGQGRKTGMLRIVAQHKVGEVHFAEGLVVNAGFAQATGEEAFYQMLLLKEGDFKFDPNARPKDKTMQASIESLLLEGMRRMDEAGL